MTRESVASNGGQQRERHCPEAGVRLAPVNEPLTWTALRARWPHRDASRFVTASGTEWHVQMMGRGPAALLLHGTGAASHSWGALAPLLADRWTVIAPDLPGHGFTAAPADACLTIDGMAAAIGGLVRALGQEPSLVVGHSAGAAVMLRMALDGRLPAARTLVGLNAALGETSPLLRLIAAPVARVASPIGALLGRTDWFAREMLASTGSRVSEAQQALYRAFLASPRHVDALVTMMGQWHLTPLLGELPRLTIPLTLVVAERDRWVPPSVSASVAPRIPRATVVRLSDVGHLAHEEAPARVAEVIGAAAA